jgi:hypothetical protein
MATDLKMILRSALFCDFTQHIMVVLVTDVSEQPIDPIFKSQAVQEEFFLKSRKDCCENSCHTIAGNTKHGKFSKGRDPLRDVSVDGRRKLQDRQSTSTEEWQAFLHFL